MFIHVYTELSIELDEAHKAQEALYLTVLKEQSLHKLLQKHTISFMIIKKMDENLIDVSY
jgi:hypothetical protein